MALHHPQAEDSARCALCGRAAPLTFHHLIPRTCHSNKWFRKNFAREDMRSRGLFICRACHSFIHRQFSEKDLGRRLNTREGLLADPLVRGFIGWVRKRR